MKGASLWKAPSTLNLIGTFSTEENDFHYQVNIGMYK